MLQLNHFHSFYYMYFFEKLSSASSSRRVSPGVVCSCILLGLMPVSYFFLDVLLFFLVCSLCSLSVVKSSVQITVDLSMVVRRRPALYYLSSCRTSDETLWWHLSWLPGLPGCMCSAFPTCSGWRHFSFSSWRSHTFSRTKEIEWALLG